jgi:hypothetical protein
VWPPWRIIIALESRVGDLGYWPKQMTEVQSFTTPGEAVTIAA